MTVASFRLDDAVWQRSSKNVKLSRGKETLFNFQYSLGGVLFISLLKEAVLRLEAYIDVSAGSGSDNSNRLFLSHSGKGAFRVYLVRR